MRVDEAVIAEKEEPAKETGKTGEQKPKRRRPHTKPQRDDKNRGPSSGRKNADKPSEKHSKGPEHAQDKSRSDSKPKKSPEKASSETKKAVASENPATAVEKDNGPGKTNE